MCQRPELLFAYDHAIKRTGDGQAFPGGLVSWGTIVCIGGGRRRGRGKEEEGRKRRKGGKREKK